MSKSQYRSVVIGGSAGGIEILEQILFALPGDFEVPMLAVQHLHPSGGGYLIEHLNGVCALSVSEARDKEPVGTGHVYLAPADYHLLVERDETLSLSVDEKVNWSRPSIDVLFESAARVWGRALVGVILSGANSDGAAGMQAIKAFGGLTIAQSPQSCKQATMPQAVLDRHAAERVLNPEEIAAFLARLKRANRREITEFEGV